MSLDAPAARLRDGARYRFGIVAACFNATLVDAMLAREGRADIAASCFAFLPTRARLDLLGWPENDIFSHE